MGVELSQILGFRKHIEKTSARTISTASSLARLMPNIEGATQLKRKLLATVIYSQLLYAAPIWANDLVFERNVNTIFRPQRTIALRIAMAYRTDSTQAIMVVAGLLPSHLKARERQEDTERKSQTKKHGRRLTIIGIRNGIQPIPVGAPEDQ